MTTANLTPCGGEMPPLFSEIQTLYPLEMEGWGQVTVPLQESPLQTLTGGFTDLAPRIQGKQFIAKDTNTAIQDSTLHDHDFILNEFAQQPNGLTQENAISWDIDLFQDFQALDTDCLNPKQAPLTEAFTTNENTIENDVIEELNLPVVTQVAAEAKDIHLVILDSFREPTLDSLIDMQPMNEIDKEWSNLSPEIQHQEEDLTGHNPLVVTGQVMPKTKKQLVGPFATLTVPKGFNESPYPKSGERDLLAMVWDDTIGPNSDEFQEWVKVDNGPEGVPNLTEILRPTTSSASSTSGEVEQQEIEAKPETEKSQQVVKRGRGRPRLPRTGPEVPKRPRGRPATAPEFAQVEDYESSSSMSSDELQDVRYRRMRDLNNAASKRCRNNRKRKFEDKEEQVKLIADKNMELKKTVEDLESQVKKFKSALCDLIMKNKTQNVEKSPTKADSSLASTSQYDPTDLSFLENL